MMTPTDVMVAWILAIVLTSAAIRWIWGHTPIRAVILTLIFVEAAIQQMLQSIYAGMEHYRENFLDTFREERRSLSQDPNFKIVRRERNS